MSGVVSFTIDAEPVPASRPRVGKFGTYYPETHKRYEGVLMKVLSQVLGLTHAGAVALRIMCVMPRYKTSTFPVHRADVDNLAKLPMDCMTAMKTEDGQPKVWSDDCMVVHLEASTRFTRDGEQPHTKIKLIPLTGSIEDYVEERFNE